MDEELRRLEKEAATGDRYCLYQLLIRKLSIDDFDLSELNEDIRVLLAVELLKSLGAELADASLMLSGWLSDSDYYPNHRNNLVCPRGHIGEDLFTDEYTLDEEDAANFIFSHVIISGNSVHGDTTAESLDYYVADSDEPFDMHAEHGLIRCEKCKAVWPATGSIQARSGWD